VLTNHYCVMSLGALCNEPRGETRGGRAERGEEEGEDKNPVHENVTNCFLYTTSNDTGIAKLLSFQTSRVNLVELLL